MRRRLLQITTILAILLLIPAAATAALVNEQRQGQRLIAQLKAGTKTCKELSANDLDHIGEYVRFRALGSTSLHQAINRRMTLMMGEQAESRVHQLIGGRYAGCSTNGLGIIGTGSMMGSGMMGGYYRDGGWSTMISSNDWSWMMGGTWRHMTRHDWNQLRQRLLGTNATDGQGWSSLAIVGATLGGVLLIAVAVAVILAIRGSRRPASARTRSLTRNRRIDLTPTLVRMRSWLTIAVTCCAWTCRGRR